jgi:hypothetical protein
MNDWEKEEKYKIIKIFDGKAKVGEVLNTFQQLVLKPDDLSSPVSLQMALSRIMDSIMKSMSEGVKKKYVAEIKFTDSMGNPVVLAVDLGENPPPLSKKEVKARIVIELYEEEEDQFIGDEPSKG